MKLCGTILIFCLFTVLGAQTIIPGGDISGTWTAAQSPYHVMGNCLIPADEILIIQPGVEVLFDNAIRLQINGSLQAEGTVADSIIFDALNPESGWNGIRCYASSLQDSTIFTHCRLSNASSLDGYWNSRGGALLLHQAEQVRIENCQFTHNTANYGGALYVRTCSPIIRHCSFRCNEALHDAGALQISTSANPLIASCIFEHNQCMYDGGAIFIAASSQPIVEECIIKENHAIDRWDYSANGGGISIWDSSPIIRNCSITRNTSAAVAGGITVGNNSDAIIEDCLISQNRSNEYGSLRVIWSNVTLSGVTICYNTSGDSGAGLSLGHQATITTDEQNRCDIFLNNTYSSYNGNNLGNDISCNSSNSATLHLGTFTFLQPDESLVYPLANFTLDIQEGFCSPVDADLFVSPAGLPSNSGLSAADPISSVFQAITMMQSSATSPHTIHLAEGTYAHATAGEVFPMEFKEGLTLSGSGMTNCILDASGTDYCLMAIEVNGASGSGFSITGATQGSVYIKESSLQLQNVWIHHNKARYDPGGGIFMRSNSQLTLTDCLIENNQAIQDSPLFYATNGGGIGCTGNSILNLAGTTIRNNTAQISGGGIWVENNSTVNWDADNRCSIYDNHVVELLYGSDLYSSQSNPLMAVIVDTFTVMNPQSQHAYPLIKFSFDIQSSFTPQIAADLYVSPTGDDTNSGLTPDDPLKTIALASNTILGSADAPHTIHLADGTYSASTNGDTFPALITDYIILEGQSAATCILDGEETSRLLIISGYHAKCQDITLKRGRTFGYNQDGGGILILGTDTVVKNTVVTQCHSDGSGGGIKVNAVSNILDGVQVVNCMSNDAGGIYVDGGVTLRNCSIRDNIALYGPGGMYIDGTVTFSPTLKSSIYNNHSRSEWGTAMDISATDGATNTVVIDTFTVMQPDRRTMDFGSTNPTVDIEQGYFSQYAADIFVSPDGAMNNSGLTPNDPLPTLNQALLACISSATDPHTIHLLPGTYGDEEYFPYTFTEPVTLEGASAQEVVLDAAGFSFFYFNFSGDFALKHATLCNANTSSGAITVIGTNMDISDCIFQNNTSSYNGIISANGESTLHLDRTLFHHNQSQYGCNALRIEECETLITNCTFSQQIISNAIPITIHCANVIILNSIFWNNGDMQIYNYSNTTTDVVLDNCLLENGENSIENYGTGTLHYMDGNINTDPLFVNGSSDFHLTAQSPCIDAGVAEYFWQNQQILAIPDSLYCGLAPDMGCFEYDNTTAGSSTAPSVTKLYGNYPNPFNPTTEIMFSLTAQDAEGAKIEIFNAKGQKVRELGIELSSRTELRDLSYSVSWDGTDFNNHPVSSGVYLYQLKAGGKALDQKKMLLLK